MKKTKGSDSVHKYVLESSQDVVIDSVFNRVSEAAGSAPSPCLRRQLLVTNKMRKTVNGH